MAATLDISKYALSSASMKKKWLADLKARMEAEDSSTVEPSPLNSGIIGYSFDVMANAIEDAYFSVNTRCREIFVSTAKFDDSVYLHAASNGINNFFAVPAVIDCLIGIKESDIINNAIVRPGLGYSMITISKNTQFRLGEYYYILDYPIDLVVKTGSGNKKLISSKYDLTVDNPFSDIESTYIHGKSQTVNNVKYYVFKTKARQMVKNSQTFTHTPSSVESDIYTVPYESQLAGFEVFYQKNNSSDWIKLQNVYLGTLNGISEINFCYYRLMDGEFEISFSSNPEHFQPEFNSKIRIDTFITEGNSGNFEYTADDITIIMNQDSTEIYEDAFSGIIPAAQLLTTTSKGGIDKPELDDLRASVIDQKASRKTIISDDDLKSVMTKYNLEVAKQRDDIYERVFMTYVLLEDQDSDYVIPSRTGELMFKESSTINQVDVDARTVPLDNVYQFWLADDAVSHNTDRFIAADIDETGLSPTTALRKKDWKYLYTKYAKYNGVLMMCPFLIKIFKDPYFVSLYDVQCNSTIGTVFGYNNYNSPEKFAINGITISRPDIRTKEYQISCEVAVSDIILEEFISSDINDFSVRVKVELLNASDETYAYIDLTTVSMNADKSKLVFSETLKTDDVLHNEDMIRIINKKITPTADEIYVGTGIVPDKYFIPFKSKLRAYIVYKPDTAFDSVYNNYMMNDAEKDEGYVVTDMFETNEPFNFVNDVSDVFSTVLEVIVSDGIYPKYPADVPALYDTVVYARNSDNTIQTDGLGHYNILHNVGDPVLDAGGQPVIAHKKGENIIKFDESNHPIYEIKPEVTYIVKNVPLVSMVAILNDTYKSIIYSKFKEVCDTIQEVILPKLIENNMVRIGAYNTIGPSSTFVQGYGTTFSSLSNLDISIKLNVKLKNSDNQTTLQTDILETTRRYMKSIMKNGYLYIGELLTYLKSMYTDIEYVEFMGINSSDVEIQTIKTNPDINTTAIVPEYISVGQTLDAEAFKLNGTVKFTPNITINIVL